MILALLVSAACTDDDDGVAPTASALTIAPTTVPVGGTTTVSGSLQFADPDGDVARLTVAITPPGGAAQDGPSTPIQGAAGMTAGTVTWAVALAPPVAGDYVLTLGVVDGADHASNPLTATVTAQ